MQFIAFKKYKIKISHFFGYMVNCLFEERRKMRLKKQSNVDEFVRLTLSAFGCW